jgi:hypothetical protein
MLFPGEEQWERWGISEDVHKFFVLRWHELFDEYTFDSWQVRSSNTRSILEEILEAIGVVQEFHASHVNIKILIDEAKKTAKEDPIIRKYSPYVPDYLERLADSYEKDMRQKEKLNVNRFSSLARVILSHLNEYPGHLAVRILDVISNTPDPYKTTLDPLIMGLGVNLISTGYSINSLRDSFRLLTSNADEPFAGRFKKILEEFNGQNKKYTVRLLIRWPGKLSKFKKYNFEILEERPLIGLSEDETEFYEQDVQAKIAVVKVESLDAYCARYAAEEILEGFFAINMLYRVTKRAKITHDLALVETQDGDRICIEPDRSRLEYIRDATNADKSIAAFAEMLSRLSSQDAGKLLAALQYHKLALNAPTDEARLVNLWIALESLTQEGGEKAIIDQICSSVPASVAIGYAYRVLRALPIAIRKLWRNTDTSAIRKILTKSSEFLLHPYDMLTILLDRNEEKVVQEFGNLVGDHPLLHYRIYSLREHFFKDAKTASKQILRHRVNIDWQIRRIYRARNYILHKGCCWPQTRQLIQHLHSYFIISMHNLVHDLRRNTSWSIADAFQHRRTIFDHFIARLRNGERQVLMDEVYDPLKMLAGIGESSPAWPQEE